MGNSYGWSWQYISWFNIRVVFSKLIFLVFLKMLKLKTDFKFTISFESIIKVLVLFGILVLVMIFYNFIKLAFLKPIDLLRSGSVGEREPKGKIIQAILGIICLGVGYYIALTAGNPMQAILTFFIAALFVILGTYLLFMCGSIVFLKILKKNKKFYYHKTHFISVSGMIYRMKQNAVGLANICILASAVLVVLSTTVALYVGIDDVMRTRFPSDVATDYLVLDDTYDEIPEGKELRDVVDEAIKNYSANYDVVMKDVDCYYEVSRFVELHEDTIDSEVPFMEKYKR